MKTTKVELVKTEVWPVYAMTRRGWGQVTATIPTAKVEEYRRIRKEYSAMQTELGEIYEVVNGTRGICPECGMPFTPSPGSFCVCKASEKI